MKKLFLLLLTLVPFLAISQNLNDYKYAIIPAKFEFSVAPNEFNMNTYTKMYLEKYGFEAYSEGEKFPADFATSRCNKVYVDVVRKKNLFTTIFVIEVKDCQNNVLFTSQEGRSKEKEYRRGFPQALRAAFESFESLNHQYNGKLHSDSNTVSSENKVSETVTSKSVLGKVEFTEDKIPVEAKADQNNKVVQKSEIASQSNTKLPVLIAKKTENGFLLLDDNKRLEFELTKTSQENIFLTSYNNNSGIFVLNGSQSRFEYYLNGTLTVKEFDVKF
jgi:hypothetical protein